MLAGAAIENHRNTQGNEEQHAEEDQHQVQIQWRIDLREIGKQQRSGQEESGLLDEPFAEHVFGSRRSKSAGGTLIRNARRTTVEAAGPALESTRRAK